MSRTMKQDAGVFRVVTKHATTGHEEVLGPYSTIGAAKFAVKMNCYYSGYERPRENYYRQTRQWFIEKTIVQWEAVPVSLVDGEWVHE